jgi:hypothetical protein
MRPNKARSKAMDRTDLVQRPAVVSTVICSRL